MESKPKILIISSADPTLGPGILAKDYYVAYKNRGYDVDLLTLNRVIDNSDFLYVQDCISIKGKLKHIFNRLHPYYLKKKFFEFIPKTENYGFFYLDEKNPPIRSVEVTGRIRKKYDLVFILFWQGMLSFKTVNEIYDKLHCVIRFNSVDYSPMAGGCHFTGECQRYQCGCGCCPALKSNDIDDITHKNVLYRKKIYKKICPIVTGNSYMFGFYDRSFLLKDVYRATSYPIIDTNQFRPMDKTALRKKYGISSSKRHLILFGSQRIDDERKGISYLVDALRIFAAKLSDEERKAVQIVVIGRDFDKLKPLLPDFDALSLGFVSKDVLPEVYSMCDVFLCSSVNDAGPMMVNQSLCCGTPVVGFAMGACLDSVKDKGTGYCAKLKDTADFADGISRILNMPEVEKRKMSEACRKLALETYSYDAAVDRTIRQYNEYLEYRKKNDKISNS